LLISKHQQVQLLEAASVLVAMNQNPSVVVETVKAADSDESASPAASGSSGARDYDSSSVETTPPPYHDQGEFPERAEPRDAKRFSTTSSVFSRSYQATPVGSVAASSVPTTASFGSSHQSGYFRRPSTSGAGPNDHASEEEVGLVSAVELLCNFRSPRAAPVQVDSDIPPVPPLPARYASHTAHRSIGGMNFSTYQQEFQQDMGLPPPMTHRISDERDNKFHRNIGKSAREEDRHRHDEYDYGVFGTMEE
jgi:hypothetical protein